MFLSEVNVVPPCASDSWGSNVCVSQGLITLFKPNALQDQVRIFNFRVLFASCRPHWISQWRHSGHLGHCLRNVQVQQHLMIQRMKTWWLHHKLFLLQFQKRCCPQTTAGESQTSANPTSAVSDEKPHWQAVIQSNRIEDHRSEQNALEWKRKRCNGMEQTNIETQPVEHHGIQ